MKWLMKQFLKIIEGIVGWKKKKAKMGIGLNAVFLLFLSHDGTTTDIDREMQRFFDAIDSLSFTIRTTWLRLMMNHRLRMPDGNMHGRKFCAYNKYNDLHSGWNQAWFDKIEEFAQKCDERGITLGIQFFDFNYIHEGPYRLSAFEGKLSLQQYQYIKKVLETLGTFGKNDEWTPKYRLISSVGNEECNRYIIAIKELNTEHPSLEWMENAVTTIKDLTCGRLLVGAWHKRRPYNADFTIKHSGIPVDTEGTLDEIIARAREQGPIMSGICINEEKLADEWGGGAPTIHYKYALASWCPRDAVVNFSNWDDHFKSGMFAKNQIEALEWGHSKGLY